MSEPSVSRNAWASRQQRWREQQAAWGLVQKNVYLRPEWIQRHQRPGETLLQLMLRACDALDMLEDVSRDGRELLELQMHARDMRKAITPEEHKMIVQGSNAHVGTVAVNAADQTITFTIETATFPNGDGAEQQRAFTLSGDELTYTVPVATGGGTGAAVWKRAK